jgi:hypothetical protein
MEFNTKRVFNVLIAFCLLFLLGGNALAAEIGLNDFVSSGDSAVDGVEEAKPLILEVVAIVWGCSSSPV